MQTILYGWAMSQIKKYILRFNEDFIKNYDKDGDKRYILEADVEYINIYMNCIVIHHSYQKD